MGNIKLHLGVKNTKGTRPLIIRYIHNRLDFGKSIGFSVEEKWVDLENLKVKEKHPHAEKINQAINEILSDFKLIQIHFGHNLSASEFREYYSRIDELKQRRDAAQKFMTIDYKEQQQQIEEKRKELEDHPFHKILAPGLEKRKEESIAYIKNLFERFLKYKQPASSKRISKGTLKGYITFINNLTEFARSKAFKKHNLSLSLEAISNSFYQGFYEWAMEKGWSDSSFGNRIKLFKTFLKWADITEGLPVHRHYKAWSRERRARSYPHYLSPTDVDLIWMYAGLTEQAHEKYRCHILVFSCLTGLRYSEIAASNFIVDNSEYEKTGRRYLVTKTIKNNNTAFLWIYDNRIIQILELYNYNLAVVSHQRFNKGVKKTLTHIFKSANIHQDVLEVKAFVNGEEKVIKKGTLAELVSAHDGRRAALTTWINHYHWNHEDVLLLIGSRHTKSLQPYIKGDAPQKRKRLSGLNLPKENNS